jgi:hypothetical protein
VPRRYPLEPLQRLRKERVETSAHKLADALLLVETSRTELERRAHQKASFEAECSRTEQAERVRLEKGAVKAGDLLQGAAYRIGADIEKAHRTGEVKKATSALDQARADAETKREGVASARADADVVDKNRQAWQAQREKEREKAEELGAEEAFSGRGRATRRGR